MNFPMPGPSCCFQCHFWIALVILCLGSIQASAEQSDEANGEETNEEARPAVQPELQTRTETTPQIELSDAQTANTRQQIETLTTSLDQRLAAVDSTLNRLAHAESLLNRLQDEYDSFELRLERAGLNLTGDYANLLKQRLERLQRHGIAKDLIDDIENQLSRAREEQLRLEEFEAIVDSGSEARDQLRSQRARLIRRLHEAVTEHIRALNQYFSTVSDLKDQVDAYQLLLQQRLFWLPSAPVVSEQTVTELFRAADWLSGQLRLAPLREALAASVQEQGKTIVFLIALLALLLFKRQAIKRNLMRNNKHVGNVGKDHIAFTLYALANTVLLTLPGVLVFAIAALTTYTLVLIGIVIFLGVIGVQWSKLQWLVAALGVGLGFGLQEIVANFVSGIILLFERPIRVGDTVTISGVTGTVSRIRIRATTLVDWDRKEQIIPNKTFVTQDLTNWTLSDSITRVILPVGVAYGSDIDQVQELLTEVAHHNERIVDDPAPAVFCVGLGDSRIDFELRVFVKDPLDIMSLTHEINAAMTRALREAGIDIPFPQQDIHLRTLAET